MEYFCLVFDDNVKSPYWNLSIDEARFEASGGDIWAFSAGRKSDYLGRVPCRVDHPGLSADFNLDALTTVPIVSARVASLILELAPSNVQLIPADLNAPGEWSVVNIVSLIDAFDDRNSIASFTDEQPTSIRGVMRLIVDPLRTGAQHLFRLSAAPNGIIVSEILMQRCQNAGFSNMKFVPATISLWYSYAKDTEDDRWCVRPWKQ